ncbi:hypothetical protein [Anaerocolumna xylanovorans]|uniref:DUF1579 domain-containing protein n=1 Tax=Anaerocolumna xylanovorans DSM 12503 TaxID=1121345 RepID=A0A1M7Y964_9FIRM|nr:hypothetical protein [Anaerocolumna xylanovorans]SHO49173.1 hypothetical protein SAMN02745217_02166 [Anaerocolumna xylanovorans DSM 12503]
MSGFTNALISNNRNEDIPAEDDLFGMLIGEWDFEWVDNNQKRKVQGEWIFSRVLEGRAIQDVFICPSRFTREANPQPDGEYGTTLRIYNPRTTRWDVSYGCTGYITRLEARREGEKIVLTNINNQNEKWVFSEITDISFHWQNVHVEKDGIWHINAELYATRIK